MSVASKIVRKGARAKPTPPAGDSALIEQRKRARDRQEAKVTPQRGSIAKKMTVSKTDIEQAKTANRLDELERRIDDMKDGPIKKAMQEMVDKKRKEFEGMQAEEMDRAGRKAAQSARDRREFKGYTPSSPFNRGGMPSRKGNFDRRKSGMFMKGSK